MAHFSHFPLKHEYNAILPGTNCSSVTLKGV